MESAGADPTHSVDRGGKSGLAVAAKAQQPHAMRLLDRLGCDPGLTPGRGRASEAGPARDRGALFCRPANNSDMMTNLR